MNSQSPTSTRPHRFRAAAIAVSVAVLTLVASAAAARKTYDLPSGDAAATLKAFTAQSGEQIVYPAESVRGIRTQAVQGPFEARAALEQMLAGTGLVVVQDAKSGALGVYPQELGAKIAAEQEAARPPVVKLEDYRVLGSRIRYTESEGPSPVSLYDANYIKSTGAFTLADFLNQIPQTYAGISSGRGATPNELNPEFGQRTESTTPLTNYVLGTSAALPGQTGVSGVSLRGLGSGSTLVLIDGRRAAQSGAGNRSSDTRQGFVDLNTIPLGMIERVEVLTDGASAIYGADAVAGVINIVLKKNYSGTEVSGSYKTAEHGGGRERNVSVMHGFSYGKLSGTVSVEYYDRQSLKASQRAFAKNQNRTAIPRGILTTDGSVLYGRDHRLAWGFPGVVQAVGGTVNGTFNAIPGARVVFVPTGATSTPAISEFTPTYAIYPPASVVNGASQRRFNTAAYLDLVPESERSGVNATFTYKFNDRYQGYASLRTSEVKSFTTAQIAGTSITGGFGTPAVLLAAYSPFAQNVQIGMMIPEWGATSQRVRTLSDGATAGVRGAVGETWQWDLGTSWQKLKTRQTTRNYNGAGFANLLNNPDPAKRYNPFIDYRAPGAPSQYDLLETLSTYPFLGTDSTLYGADFTADGDLFAVWGGSVKMAWAARSTAARWRARR